MFAHSLLKSLRPLAIATLGLGLLLPNHSPPWMSFWQELFAALSLGLLSVELLLRGRLDNSFTKMEVGVLLLAMIPTVQYLSGKILFFQTAWLSTVYLLGLLLAIRVGASLERDRPQQALTTLLTSFLAAALCSVGLQIYQILFPSPDNLTPWVFRISGGRAAANIGQPNALGSILLLGLLAVYWLWRTRLLRAMWASSAGLILCAGLSLTQSRTALLNAILITIALVYINWRSESTRTKITLFALLFFTLATFAAYATWISISADPARGDLLNDRISIGVRPQAWAVLTQALMQNPITGYGWGQIYSAQLTQSPTDTPLYRTFLQAHNLPLELALSIGIPAATIVLAGLSRWIYLSVKGIRDEATAVMHLALMVPMVHALVEYPLHYAYFLLPVGVLMGAIGVRCGFRSVAHLPGTAKPLLIFFLWAACALTTRDYLILEKEYRGVLLERAGITTPHSQSQANSLVLDSLSALLEISRLQPTSDMSTKQLELMRRLVHAHPGAEGLYKLAIALTLNGHDAEAQDWVNRVCRTLPRAHCKWARTQWALASKREPGLTPIVWPQ